MTDRQNGYVSDWKPVSVLKQIDHSIADLGYSIEYARASGLEAEKEASWTSYQPEERVCYFEPLEVKEENGIVWFRENDSIPYVEAREPESFQTQFGTFRNHNNGEFMSWMEWEDPDHPVTDVFDMGRFAPRGDNAVDGNFCDMFDCGPYAFAISNLMHLGSGSFSVIRFDGTLETKEVFANGKESFSCLEYLGRYRDDDGFVIIASGSECSAPELFAYDAMQPKTFLLRLSRDGKCTVLRECDFRLSSSTGLLLADGCVWVGQNKMVSCLDPSSGEVKYYTHKSDDALAALKP